MTTTETLLTTWLEARTRFANLLLKIDETSLSKKLIGTQNSVGFLIRHIAEVEMLFAKNVFGATNINIHAKTIIAQHDTGEWTNLSALIQFQEEAFNQLKLVIEQQPNEAWEESITTKEFGTKTKAAALGRIISHTAYHAGQLAIILKYA
ncbi:DinB family protein [Hydrotalea sp.]|uniref:DinB family protein n=1 Tax=Hydrotalea sp. TaxID=2881279 RepID=UPI003D118C04